MTNKEIKLSDKQLGEVVGGKNGNCEPKANPFRMDGPSATLLKVCSDITHKGSKPECANCEANK